MKLKNLLIISMLVFSMIALSFSVSSKERIEKKEINDGLVAYWSFENCDDSVVYDDSVNQNNLNYVGENFGPDSRDEGLFGKCMRFDGVDDYLNCSYLLVSEDVGTVSLWFKRTGESNGELHGGALYRNGNNQPLLFAQNTGTWHPGVFQAHWAYADNMSLGGNHKSYTYHYGASLNNWHYVAFSWTLTEYYVFFDGQLVEHSDFDVASVTGSETCIGMYGLDNYFNGSIDEIRVYDRVITIDEISTYYYSIRDHLLGHWSFDNYNTLQVEDDSQNDNPAVFHGDGFGPISTTEGVIGEALEFDGVDDYLLIENDYCYSPTSPICMEGWIYPINLSYNEGWHYYFGMRGFNSGIVHMADGKICAEYRNETGEITVYPIIEQPENKWYHVVWQWSEGIFEVYVNSVKIVDEPHATHHNYVKNFAISTAPHVPGQNSYNCVKAKFDEIRIWDRSLSHDEIKDIYNVINDVSVAYLFEKLIYKGFIDLNLSNTGDVAITQIDYNLSMQGGIFNKINTSVEGVITDFQPGQYQIITTEDSPIGFGLGLVDVKLLLEVDTGFGQPKIIEEPYSGLVIGKMIIIF